MSDRLASSASFIDRGDLLVWKGVVLACGAVPGELLYVHGFVPQRADKPL